MLDNIKKYSELPKEGLLPADVNHDAELVAAEFDDDELMVMMGYARKKRLYGEATHFSKPGVPSGIFNFQNGVCMRFNPIRWFSKKNVFKGSKIFYR